MRLRAAGVPTRASTRLRCAAPFFNEFGPDRSEGGDKGAKTNIFMSLLVTQPKALILKR